MLCTKLGGICKPSYFLKQHRLLAHCRLQGKGRDPLHLADRGSVFTVDCACAPKLHAQQSRSTQQSLITAAMRLQLLLQGNGTADGYGDFVGTGTLQSYDGYFQGSGTFMGAGDCEGTMVYSS